MSHRRAIESNPVPRSRRRAAELRVESVERRILMATFTVNSNADAILDTADRFESPEEVPVSIIVKSLSRTPTPTPFLSSVAPGDFDGDGVGDVAVTYDDIDQGLIYTYVLFGPITLPINVSDIQSIPRSSLINTISVGQINDQTTVTTTGDFNGDGRLDVAVGLPAGVPTSGTGGGPWVTTSGSVLVLTNPGITKPVLPIPSDVQFSTFLLDTAATRPGQIKTIAAGDVNGDGLDDLAIMSGTLPDFRLNYIGGNHVAVYTGTSGGDTARFGPGPTYILEEISPDSARYAGIALGRFQASSTFNRLDLAILDADETATYGSDVRILPNLSANPGSGLFSQDQARTFGFNQPVTALNAGDFDADGLTDLVALSTGVNSGSVLIASVAAGTISTLNVPGVTGFIPFSIAVGDLNDGSPDIIPSYDNLGNPVSPQAFYVVNSRTTLRDAINRANQTPNRTRPTPAVDVINFGLDDPTISLKSFLPVIIDPVAINGYSQPDARANTLADGDEAVLNVVITAADDAPVFDAFTINRTLSGGTSIRGLVINNLAGSAILVAGEAGDNAPDGGVVIAGNRIGVDRDGTNRRGNGGQGIRLHATSGVTVGGTSPADRNIISGNGGSGIKIDVSGPNLIAGNYIGTDRTGRDAIGNVLDGIQINDSSSITVGGADPSARNIISGNGTNGEGAGVNIDGAGSQNNAILGNYIGVDREGNGDLGNTLIGVFVGAGASGTTIRDNVITGNGTDDNSGVGVYLYRSSGTTIDRNKIGTNAGGTALVGGSPSAIGVLANDSSNNVIGAPDAANRNVISGHKQIGVYLARETAGDRPIGQGSANNLVQNNFIGTDFDGLVAIPNGADGVNIANSPNNRVINNLISGNLSTGIQLFGATSTGNTVASNRIGLNANNAPTLPNGNSSQVGGGVGIFNNTGGASNTIANNSGQTGIVDGPGVSVAATSGERPTAQNVTKVVGKGKKGARHASAAQHRKAGQARARQAANLAARSKAHKVKVSQAHPRGPARDAR